jgi:hypothetical protein
MTSDLGINPTNDGNVIRLAFPPLTEERRKELVKVVRHKAEEGRVAVRNLRRSGRHELDALQKDGSLSTDELERVEKELEKITQEQVSAIDHCWRKKSASSCRFEGGVDHDRRHGPEHLGERGRRRPSGIRSSTAPMSRPEVDEDPPSYRSGSRPHHRRRAGRQCGPRGDGAGGRREPRHAALERRADRAGARHPRPRQWRRAGVAPPRWREDDTDWAAHEELFEPSMLSDELPAVGSMMNDNNDQIDVERQPWRFDTDDMPSDEDTLQIEPDFPPDPIAGAGGAVGALRRRRPVAHRSAPDRPRSRRRGITGDETAAAAARPARPRGAPTPDCRPPRRPEPRARAPRATRLSDEGLNGNTGEPGDATCSSPGARDPARAWRRFCAPTSGACPPWSSSPSSSSSPRPRASPPSERRSTTRPRCSGWWPSSR